MRPRLYAVLAAGLLAAALASPATAQEGFALKGSYIYNRSEAPGTDGTTQVPGANGFGIGVEYVWAGGFGLAVSGYTGGKIRDFDAETSTVSVVAEANYFFRPEHTLRPYLGVHAGLGRYSRTDEESPGIRPRDGLRQLGLQAGLRLQLASFVGLDAQYRRVSTSLQTDQDVHLSRNQLLLGITLF